MTTLGAEFPRGLEGEYRLDGFPDSESAVVIRWEESLQNFVIVDRYPLDERRVSRALCMTPFRGAFQAGLPNQKEELERSLQR